MTKLYQTATTTVLKKPTTKASSHSQSNPIPKSCFLISYHP